MVCPYEGLAMDAAENVIPMIAKSLLVPAGEPLLSRMKALPAIESLFDCHVTKASLRKMSEVAKSVKRYSHEHTDPVVKLRARTLREAWREIFLDQQCKHGTAAALIAAQV